MAILLARLVPIFPFNLLNYASGVTGIRTREYVVATVVGIIPGTYAYAALGGSLGDWTSPEFLTAVAMVVVLGVGGTIYARQDQARRVRHRVRRRREARADRRSGTRPPWALSATPTSPSRARSATDRARDCGP